MKPPGDIQIDMAIHKLGLGSPCLPKLINAKVDRWLKEQMGAGGDLGKPHVRRPRRG
jgi:hypothetical protein